MVQRLALMNHRQKKPYHFRLILLVMVHELMEYHALVS